MNLLMLTKFFPFGTGEAFIENEIKIISEFYEKITIIACEVTESDSKTVRNVPENVTVYRIPAASKKKDIIKGIFRSGNFGTDYKKEKKECRTLTQRMFLKYFEQKCQRIYKSITDAGYINDVIKKPFMIYSYWFFMTARVGALIADEYKPVKMFTRAHRYDLYKEQNKTNYLPYRKLFLQTYDVVLPCSDDGTAYLQKQYPKFKNKIHTALLGTLDHGIGSGSNDGVFRIVSCSRAEPVKRIDKIIEALGILNNSGLKIEWTHIGGGALLSELKRSADKQLTNIPHFFPGNMKNSDVLHFYQEQNTDLFLNVSSSEGLPVSMMEAISFGIPCVGTDVGGTKEIVVDGITGKLVSIDFAGQELADIIESFVLKKSVFVDRNKCRQFWESKFQAIPNYKKVFGEITNEQNN